MQARCCTSAFILRDARKSALLRMRGESNPCVIAPLHIVI